METPLEELLHRALKTAVENRDAAWQRCALARKEFSEWQGGHKEYERQVEELRNAIRVLKRENIIKQKEKEEEPNGANDI